MANTAGCDCEHAIPGGPSGPQAAHLNSRKRIAHVKHLGARASYRLPTGLDRSKPTVVLVNSFLTNSDLYQRQFSDLNLTENLNLLAIEPLGHGETECDSDEWNYWDTAKMNLEVMDALGIEEACLVGTSQGGWIVAMMALLAPHRVPAILPLGSSMDSESQHSRDLGCWDGISLNTPAIETLTSDEPTPDFVMPDGNCEAVLKLGFGKHLPPHLHDFWFNELKRVYSGDLGRKKARMNTINLRDQESLLGKIPSIECPVLWIHGTADVVYSTALAEEEIRLFTGSPDARLATVHGGAHFLNVSSSAEVNRYMLEFVQKHR